MNKEFLLDVVRSEEEREPADIVSAADTLKLNFNVVPVKIYFLNDGEKVAYIIDLFNIPISNESFIEEVQAYLKKNSLNTYDEFEIEDFNQFSYPIHIPTRLPIKIEKQEPRKE